MSGLQAFAIRRNAFRTESLPYLGTIQRPWAHTRALRWIAVSLAVVLVGVVPFTMAHAVAAVDVPAAEGINAPTLTPASAQVFVLQVTERGCYLIDKVHSDPSQQPTRVAGVTYVYVYAGDLNDAYAELCSDHTNQSN